MRLLSNKTITTTKTGIILKKSLRNNPINNQNGSIIVITLMLLVTITLIGLVFSETAVTENFIIRNQAIYKQNFSMVDAALMEGNQLVQNMIERSLDDKEKRNEERGTLNWRNLTDTDRGKGVEPLWANDAWYALNSSVRLLNAATSLDINASQILADRNEAAAGNLLITLIEFDPSNNGQGGGQSLGTGKTTGTAKIEYWEGRLRAEYLSTNNNYGTLRMEMGMRRQLEK